MSTTISQPLAAVVITTKNRKDDLRIALKSAVSQTVSLDIVVVDDGSTDGTSEMVRTEFPSVRLDRHEQSQGYIVHRNRGADLTDARIVFSIDDDAAFSTPYVVEQVLKQFDHPRIGAVAIPFIDVKKSPEIKQLAPDDRQIWATYMFIGTAHALRRELFIQLGRYRQCLFHQGEERDYAIRMLNKGYIVRLGSGDVIHHFESPKRDFRRMDYFGRRNDILYTVHNTPLLYLFPQLFMTTVNGIRHGFRTGRLWRMLYGLSGGYVAGVKFIGWRRAVSLRTFRLSRILKKRPCLLQDIEPQLPARDASPGMAANPLSV